MKKYIIFMGVLLGAIMFIAFTHGCDSPNNETKSIAKKPLNISVFLDLSDRLKNETSGMKQSEKDTAIVNNIVDLFVERVLGNKIIGSSDCFKVFFYPQPKDGKINELATKMEYDFAKMEMKLKKHELEAMKGVINANLNEIYTATIENNKWPGCDIWGFFKDKVKPLCIKKDSRNVLIILTDGYIYHDTSKIVEGNKTSYILPSVLTSSNPELICKTKGLEDLEVLILEIDDDPKKNDKIKELISNWLKEMGVSRYEIHSTDLPNNTKKMIEDFLK